MTTTDLLIIAAGVFLYALFSRKGESGSVTGPMMFTAFGLLIGGEGLGLVHLSVDNAVIDRLAQVTLVLALFTDAARIDVTRLNAEHSLPIRLLGIGLPLTMLLGTVVAWILFPGMGLWPAAVLGVILAPTDAALGQAVVANPQVPQRIRQGLNVESGLNDGLAFPVLLIVLSLAIETHEGRDAGDWGLFVLQQVTLGPLAGLAIGVAGARAVEFCVGRDWMNQVFLQISVLCLALLAYAGAEAVGGNGYIGAFAAGMAVASRSRHILDAVEDFGETEGQLLNLIVFLLFGALMLPAAFTTVTWSHVLYAVLSLTVIRMGPVALSLIGMDLRPVTVGFIAWFGPRGLASILYLLLVMEDGAALSGMTDLTACILLTVGLSVLLHGATAAPFARAYAGALAVGRAPPRTVPQWPEHRPVFPFPTRLKPWRRRRKPDQAG